MDHFETERELCMVFEYVNGCSLRHLIKIHELRRTRVPVQVGAEIIIRALKGLHYIHTFDTGDDQSRQPLVHGYIHPTNVLVGRDGSVRVGGFGRDPRLDSSGTVALRSLYSAAAYLSPEQVRGEPVTPRADIFSTAVTLVEVMTGRRLFDAGTVSTTIVAIAQRPRVDLSISCPELWREMNMVLTRALSNDPDDRPRTALEFADDLDWALRRRGLTRADDTAVIAAMVDALAPHEVRSRRVRLMSGHHRGRAPSVAVRPRASSVAVRPRTVGPRSNLAKPRTGSAEALSPDPPALAPTGSAPLKSRDFSPSKRAADGAIVAEARPLSTSPARGPRRVGSRPPASTLVPVSIHDHDPIGDDLVDTIQGSGPPVAAPRSSSTLDALGTTPTKPTSQVPPRRWDSEPTKRGRRETRGPRTPGLRPSLGVGLATGLALGFAVATLVFLQGRPSSAPYAALSSPPTSPTHPAPEAPRRDDEGHRQPFGLLTVRAPPGALVLIDDDPTDYTVPILRLRVRPGHRLVRIIKGDYLRVFEVYIPASVHIDVTGGRRRIIALSDGVNMSPSSAQDP